MRRVLLFLCTMLIISTIVYAETVVKFVWEANTEPDLMEYRLYQSSSSGNYYTDPNKTMYDTSKMIATFSREETESGVMNVRDGSWYWILTAVDLLGNESEPSNELNSIFDTSAPASPGGFQIQIEGTLTIRINNQ